MESTAYPLNMTLKEEEEEEEIQNRELEDGPTDMQKVRICSEGGWVSKKVWSPHIAVRGRPGNQACIKSLPQADIGSKNSLARCVCIPEKTVCGFKRHSEEWRNWLWEQSLQACSFRHAIRIGSPRGHDCVSLLYPWVPYVLLNARHLVDTNQISADLCERKIVLAFVKMIRKTIQDY